MNTRNLSRRIRIAASFMTVAFLMACATPLTEEEQLAREYERVERHESIRNFMAACESAGHSVFYTGPSYQRLSDPVKRIPGGARLTHYQCVNQTAVARFMNRGG